jgi:FkbM family methyltransferase
MVRYFRFSAMKSWIYRNAMPELFTIIFNTSRLFRKIHMRAKYKRQINAYVVSDGSVLKLASVKSRVLMYAEGFDERYVALGKSYMLDKINFERNSLIIDVGANMGDFFFAVRNFANCDFKYIGFEPNPQDYFCLTKNLSATTSKIDFQQVALWNSDTELEFFVDTEFANSSIIKPKHHSSVIKVNAQRLDSLIAESVFLLKVEAEGAEPEVLAGAKNLLPITKYVVVDVGPERGELEEETLEQVSSLLRDSGFSTLIKNSGHRKTILFKNNNIQKS